MRGPTNESEGGGTADDTDTRAEGQPNTMGALGSNATDSGAACARRGLDISGCAEKGDLLRLLNIRTTVHSADVDSDEGGIASDAEELDADSSIMALKYECARRALDISGCAEKNDLLRLLKIPLKS